MIRSARPDEAAALTALVLRSKAFWGYDEQFMQAAASELSVTEKFLLQHHSFVLERDGQVIGFSSLIEKEEQLVLENLFISPESIRQGNGQLLWEHAVGFARQHGYKTITLVSDPFAVDFYLKQGARITGQIVSNIQPDRYLPQMCFELE